MELKIIQNNEKKQEVIYSDLREKNKNYRSFEHFLYFYPFI